MRHQQRQADVQSASVFYRQIAEWLWLLVIIATPWLLNPVGEKVFTTPKVALIRSVALLLAAVGAVGWFFSGRPRPKWRNPALWLWLGYGGLLVGQLLRPNAYQWFGSPERQNGIFFQLSLCAIALAIACGLKHPKQWQRLQDAWLLAGLPVSLYAIAQALGWDMHSTWQLNFAGRSSSTLGNPTFLAGLLALLYPLVVARWQIRQQRWLWVGYAGLLAGALGCSQSRAAILAAAAGGLAMFAWQTWQARQKRLFWASVGLAGLGLLTLIWLNLPNASALPNLARLNTLTQSSGRTNIWRAVWPLSRERLLLGWGADQVGTVYAARVGTVLYSSTTTIEQPTAVDSAHNVLLEQVFAFGLLGGGLWLALVGYSLWRTSQQRNALTMPLLFSLLTYLVVAQFGAPNPSEQLYFWVLLGALQAPWTKATPELEPLHRTSSKRWQPSVAVGLAIGALLQILGYGWLQNSKQLTGVGQILWAGIPNSAGVPSLGLGLALWLVTAAGALYLAKPERWQLAAGVAAACAMLGGLGRLAHLAQLVQAFSNPTLLQQLSQLGNHSFWLSIAALWFLAAGLGLLPQLKQQPFVARMSLLVTTGLMCGVAMWQNIQPASTDILLRIGREASRQNQVLLAVQFYENAAQSPAWQDWANLQAARWLVAELNRRPELAQVDDWRAKIDTLLLPLATKPAYAATAWQLRAHLGVLDYTNGQQGADVADQAYQQALNYSAEPALLSEYAQFLMLTQAPNWQNRAEPLLLSARAGDPLYLPTYQLLAKFAQTSSHFSAAEQHAFDAWVATLTPLANAPQQIAQSESQVEAGWQAQPIARWH